MNDFKFKGTVNHELTKRYEYKSVADAKNDAALAKRLATQLTQTVSRFEYTVKPEQRLALQAAANVMKAMATELAQVVVWSKAYKVHCDQVALAEKTEEQDAAAVKRWGGDSASMLTEAKELIDFLGKGKDQGSHELIQEWAKCYRQLPKKCSVKAPLGSYYDLTSQLEGVLSKPSNQLSQSDVLKIKRLTAELLRCFFLSDKNGSLSESFSGNVFYYLGADDYEAWRAWRKSVHAAIAPAFS